MEILSLDPDHKNIDMIKINKFIISRYEKDKNNKINNQLVINIPVNNSGLTKRELDIAKGIILANGHDYWEF